MNLAGIDRSSSGVVLQCESKGWYPEPEVFWLDAEGNLLSAGPTETVRGPDDLYTVSSRVTVEKRHSNNFTCRVQQKNINLTRETHFYVPDDFFVAPCSSAPYVILGLVVSSICVLAVVFAVWKRKKNKIKTNKALQREQQLLMHAQEIEEMKKTELELEKKHKDMVDTLTTQKDQLGKLKNKVKKQVEDNKTKFNSVVNNKIEQQEYLDLRNVTSDYQKDLTGTLSELETLELDVEKLLKSTQNIEGIKEAENHMDEEKTS
ncbi:butyrophilin subfamily 2 member A2-like [Larimichthys crocea]|uniref:butyrophilin subfamily 2 member A2-like n=1 Tax=Larimichthys crocea TaxID=215358 RepID=UPI000F5FA13F|nr:butyrophilin subfamily 2 member A2-like [Larimichthys crocea]